MTIAIKPLKKSLKKHLSPEKRAKLREARDLFVRMGYRFIDWQLRWFPGGIDQMMCFRFERLPFTAELVLRGFEEGIFAASEESSGRIRWYSPAQRGVLPIHGFHVPKDARRLARKAEFEITVDTAFEKVIQACRNARKQSWIDSNIISVFSDLHRMGHAHSVEIWKNGDLVAGAYGVAIGGLFAGESQFHRLPNTGKLAMVYLMHLLEQGGFVLHDTQWINPYLETYGAYEISREEYKRRLTQALITPAVFKPLDHFELSGDPQ